MSKNSIIVLLSCLFAFTSCNNWLDVVPENEQVSGSYWQSKEEAEAVLTSGYIYLRDMHVSLLEWGELRGSSIYKTIGYSPLQSFNLNADNKSVCNWGPFYKVISMANSVLANVEYVQQIDDTFNEAQMNSFKAEAYFLRALSYFYIVRNWRDAPLILSPYEDDSQEKEVAKSTEAEIIAQIKEDLTTAIKSEAAKAFFEEDWQTKGRATKWAIYALMADVCLWNGDYSEAIVYCNNILEASESRRPAFVEDSEQWFEMFYPGNSNESIFEIQFYGSSQTNQLASLFGNSIPTYQYTDEMLVDFVTEAMSIDGYPDLENQVRTINAGIVTDNADLEIAKEGYVWKYTGTGTNDNVRPSSEQNAHLILYRVADVMLMKAEAMVLNDNSAASWNEALNIVNRIRARAHAPQHEIEVSGMTELDMLKLILSERNIELAAEGKRWYDLLRLGRMMDGQYRDAFIDLVVKYNNSARAEWIRSVLRNDDALFLPIWSSELINNPKLVQNPYYDIVQ
ncbi:RagB/SusD family nutrient uptake outer membrane protein [Mangrovibacterium marinum]|uniref:Putative outer membrane starch-binding protein n=1 Tax=Mangrovibacterium marinum TaxID=1639118 RepID=A0A2T5C4L2_9BACT|nr:RagB/SusD family nutrient uptake outer membrane protein [Mangrovibacterium marinum]PTN09808.1 putative outer membrane starch-binding protein [Mangrovibacterium marinum]